MSTQRVGIVPQPLAQSYRLQSPLSLQAVSAICRQAGHRFGDHVERIVPLVLQFAADARDDDELREHCLQVIKNFWN